MIYDNLLEKLATFAPDIKTIKTYWNQSGREQLFKQLKMQTEAPDFWQHQEQAQVSKELQQIQTQRTQYHAILESYKELEEMLQLFKHDEAELTKLSDTVDQIGRTVQKFKIALLLNRPEDASNCFLTINAGAGGTESQDWANMLLRMYLRFCEQNNLSAQVVDIQTGEETGIKSATLYIKGKNAYGLLKGEAGIHRLVRISPFDASKRRHTSFAAVAVTPEQPEIEITIDPSDLRIDTYRASGAGGQHVNKTESAVRITHLPTNTVVQCQNERSQLQNRETAMKMLKAKLIQKKKEEEEAQLRSKEKKKIEWGSQIRSYVLHPYKMVKDHRTKVESSQPDLVLDGLIMPFIEGYLTTQPS